nr:MAG TPA: hypothetical protein [Crassvirales sp.]
MSYFDANSALLAAAKSLRSFSFLESSIVKPFTESLNTSHAASNKPPLSIY